MCGDIGVCLIRARFTAQEKKKKSFFIPTFGINSESLCRNVKSAHNILPQLIFYLTHTRAGDSRPRENIGSSLPSEEKKKKKIL